MSDPTVTRAALEADPLLSVLADFFAGKGTMYVSDIRKMMPAIRESLASAGLLVTDEMAAVVETAKAWQHFHNDSIRWNGYTVDLDLSDAVDRLAAAVKTKLEGGSGVEPVTSPGRTSPPMSQPITEIEPFGELVAAGTDATGVAHPGDTLVISADAELTIAEADAIKAQLLERLPGIADIVLVPGLRLELIYRTDQRDEGADQCQP